MHKQLVTLSAGAMATILLVASCGGDTSIGTATTTQGIITGFGSVFVDGVEFAIPDGTPISMDGKDASASELRVGMLVTLKGTVNNDGKTGTATSIEYVDQMEGVVTANNVNADGIGTLTVMGQAVSVNADTIFDSRVVAVTSPAMVQAGNVVEVSGYASSYGDVIATRIEVLASSRTVNAVIEVKGISTNLDIIKKTFTLGSLTVDYSTLTSASLPITGMADGQYVTVYSSASFNGIGPLIASKIQLTDDGVKGHQGALGEELEIKGLVTSSFANGQFEINGRTVLIDRSTRIKDGSAAQLITDTPLKIHSHFDANGALVADKIDFSNATKIQMEGNLQAVDLAAGTATVLGQTIYVDNNTVMLDKSDSAMRCFKLAELNPGSGDYLKINVYPDSNTGKLVATMLERRNYSAQAKIIGIADTDHGLKIAGIPIDISTATGNVPALNNGRMAKAIGLYSDGVFHASHVSLDG